MSVNARVQAIFVTYRLTYAVVTLAIIRRNKIIINQVKPRKITRIVAEEAADLIGTPIIGESSGRIDSHVIQLPLTYFVTEIHLRRHLIFFLSLSLCFFVLEIIIVASTTLINGIIISSVTFSRAADPISTIRTSRITTTIAIKTATLRNAAAAEIGIIAADRALLRALRALNRAMETTSSQKELQQRLTEFPSSRRHVKSRQSIHAGRSLLSKTSTVDQAATVANGTTRIEATPTTPFRYHVMSASSWSCSAQPTRASILTSTKTFPWKRRASRCRNTLQRSTTSS